MGSEATDNTGDKDQAEIDKKRGAGCGLGGGVAS